MLFTEDIGRAPDTEIVCWCSSVSKAHILAAIQEGAHNLEDIKRVTGACTQGKCKEKNPRGR